MCEIDDRGVYNDDSSSTVNKVNSAPTALVEHGE